MQYFLFTLPHNYLKTGLLYEKFRYFKCFKCVSVYQNITSFLPSRDRDSVFGIKTSHKLEGSGFELWWKQAILLSHTFLYRPWEHPNLLCKEYRGFFLELKRSRCGVYQLSPSRAENQNMQIYASTPFLRLHGIFQGEGLSLSFTQRRLVKFTFCFIYYIYILSVSVGRVKI